VPFLLKLVIVAGAASVLLAWISGVPLVIAFAVTIVLAAVIGVGNAMLPSGFHRLVGALQHGPAVVWNLIRLQKALQPGIEA